MEKIRLLLYCTKSRKRLFFDKLKQIFTLGLKKSNNDLNGKIVAECEFEVEEIKIDSMHYTNTIGEFTLQERSCLNSNDLFNYLSKDNGYAIHIKNLNIFDRPRELSDYYRFDGVYNNINNWKYIDNAPQNMMYAYELISELGWSGTYNRHFEKKIIISIRPEYLVKILNGEKTIELRKKILKEMMSK